MDSAVAFAALSFMSAQTTVAPSSASRTADASPIPEPAPVTIAIRPSTLPDIATPLKVCAQIVIPPPLDN